MQALVFEDSLARIVATKALAQLTPRAFTGPLAPIRLREIAEPRLPAPDWALLRTQVCGICGSDAKQVFLNGSVDNPMTGMISFPQVLGHEVVATVERPGPGAPLTRGARVVLNPWLSCATRGLPLCAWCERGELALCTSFRRGTLAPGLHHGTSSAATGGFAALLAAHASQCIAIPDDVSDEQAVLADPFSVALHAVLHSPPPEGGLALVYGCGTLGLCAIAALRALFPSVRVIAVARFAHQRALAEKLGAARVLAHRPEREIIAAIAQETGAEEVAPWRGLAMPLGGVDVVYDTVGAPRTVEVGVRVVRSRGRISVTGVEKPARFEWTPLYFKEIALVGSNAFGFETIGGRRQHAFAWYFELVQRGLDVTPIVTHRFRLAEYRRAFAAAHDQAASGAVKILFDFHAAP
ncbi:MAG TPA: zinc-binding dehydrogenase [Myxococcota bacterium]|nr:zinc-binding dehydrogenase [Myxococcota bacterium]